MKKKLISLFLAAVMIIACFAGCGKKDTQEATNEINAAASESAMTLVMYLLADEEVDPEKAAAIETAVNRITKSKFKTQLKLCFYTEDEYYEKLEESFAKRMEAEANGLVSTKATDETAEDETFENMWGVVEIKYPTVTDYQVDIFYMGDTSSVSGYHKYVEYMEMNMLQRLDEELSSASKLLNSYITPSILKYMKEANGGSTYAIPNNFAIGEYTYLLVNKKALADFTYDTDKGLADFTSITADTVKNFLSDVATYRSDSEDYTQVLYSNLSQDTLASTGIHYWGIDEFGNLTNDFSVLASNITDGAVYGKKSSYLNSDTSPMTSVLNTDFVDQLYTVKEYKKAYNYDSEAAAKAFADGKVAMACINGGAEIPDLYADDYEAIVVGKPTLNTFDLYRNMFAVTSYSTSTARSMEIITYLNTNEDFRNLIQYGIEDSVTGLLDADGEEIKDRDYKLVETEVIDPRTGKPYVDPKTGKTCMVVERIANDDDSYDYVMNVNRTGNTFIVSPTESENPWALEYVRTQNNDAVVSLTMGFRTDYNDYNINTEALLQLKELSASVLERLLAYELEDTDAAKAYRNFIYEIVDELDGAAGRPIRLLQDIYEPETEESLCGLAYVYMEWGVAKKLCERPVLE